MERGHGPNILKQEIKKYINTKLRVSRKQHSQEVIGTEFNVTVTEISD